MNIKRNCIFLPDREKEKTDAKLRYRIKWNGNTVAFNVGFRIDIDKWSSETHRCKNNTTHGKKKIAASVINREIGELERISEAVFANFEKQNRIPEANEFRSEFNKALGKTEPESDNLFDVFDKFVRTQSLKNSWTVATVKRVNIVKKLLWEFDSTLTFASINENRMESFVRHLFMAGYKNTTSAKNISITRWFLRWANDNGHYSGNLHKRFKPNLKGTDGKNREIIHLTWDELICVYNYRFDSSKDYIVKTRDVFCLCCFTGLRYSDAASLKKSDVKENHISVVMQKTSSAVKIELNKYSKAILEKYVNVDLPDNRALPAISNQKMNSYLKEMGEICGLNDEIKIVYFSGNNRIEEVHPKHKLLSTHCGRRTFIVNALYLGIPAEVVMKWTGHSDYAAMKLYIKIVDELKEKEMNKFNLK
jgi:site-specific recombinase XerD